MNGDDKSPIESKEPSTSTNPTPAPTKGHDYFEPPATTEQQLERIKEYANHLENKLTSAEIRKFSVQRLTKDAELLQFYTGFRLMKISLPPLTL